MHKCILFIVFFFSQVLYSQSRSVSKFRADHKENSNVFFYKSTLQMLNTENNPELTDMLKDIEEIRVLNYDKEKQHLTREDIAALKKSIREENYNNLMNLNEKNNKIDLYSREKHEKTVGLIALVDKGKSFILIDLTGNIDVQKFMQLKLKLDSQNSR